MKNKNKTSSKDQHFQAQYLQALKDIESYGSFNHPAHPQIFEMLAAFSPSVTTSVVHDGGLFVIEINSPQGETGEGIEPLNEALEELLAQGVLVQLTNELDEVVEKGVVPIHILWLRDCLNDKNAQSYLQRNRPEYLQLPLMSKEVMRAVGMHCPRCTHLLQFTFGKPIIEYSEFAWLPKAIR